MLDLDSAVLTTDVLIVGGGPAGTWAAIKARQAGADVTLVDKGHCSASGATASSRTAQHYRLVTGGLDELWTRPDVPVAAGTIGGRAA